MRGIQVKEYVKVSGQVTSRETGAGHTESSLSLIHISEPTRPY